VQLGYEASFKLTQVCRDNETKKFIEITAAQSQQGAQNEAQCVRSYIEVNTIFTQQLYPDLISKKEASFTMDQALTNTLLGKFVDRFEVLEDESAVFKFTKSPEEAMHTYFLSIQSGKINVKMPDYPFNSVLKDPENPLDVFQVKLKRNILDKFFRILKL